MTWAIQINVDYSQPFLKHKAAIKKTSLQTPQKGEIREEGIADTEL